MKYKSKAISPVVATALLLIVSVVSVVSFQGWFGNFSSNLFVKVERDSFFENGLSIETIEGDRLYLRNSGEEIINVSIVKISGTNCNINQSISNGIFSFDLKSCDSNLHVGENEIVVYTNRGILSKFVNLKTNIEPVSNNILFAKTFGGALNEEINSVLLLSNEELLVSGYTNTYGLGSTDYWVLKLNATGDMIWNKTYGGTVHDELENVIMTSDGNFILVGDTNTYGAGAYDFWLVKIDSEGNTLWNKTYGGTGEEHIRSIFEDDSQNLILGGYTTSFGAGSNDYWVLKVNSSGGVIWNKTYGGSGSEILKKYGILKTLDNNYFVYGYTTSFGAGGNDYWLVKINSSGDMIWNKTYGGTGNERPYAMILDGNDYVIGGYTSSSFATGLEDYWLVKINSGGDMIWNKTYGVSGRYSNLRNLIKLDSGDLLASGLQGPSSYNMSLVKFTNNGDVIWDKTYGGASGSQVSETLMELPSSKDILIGGFTTSYGGGYNLWLLRLDENGNSCDYFSSGNC